MTDPLLSDARALAHRLGLIEPAPHGENALKESAVRAIQAFALRQRAAGIATGGAHWPISERLHAASRLIARAKEIEG